MISIMIPALNEQENIFATIRNVIDAAASLGLKEYEIIAVNDGSTDLTASILDKCAKEFSQVRVIHNSKNRGIGQSFLDVVKIAKYDKITTFAGDNNTHPTTIRELLAHVNKADITVLYFINTESRNRMRNLISVIFSTIYVTTFGLHIKYINGNAIYPTKLIRQLKISSMSYSIFAEITVKILRKGVSFYEVAGYTNPDTRQSQALRLKTLFDVVKNYLQLVYEIHFKNREQFSKKSWRVGLPEFKTEESTATSAATISVTSERSLG